MEEYGLPGNEPGCEKDHTETPQEEEKVLKEEGREQERIPMSEGSALQSLLYDRCKCK